MSKLPVVIHHIYSCPDYLKKCVEINAKRNKVWLLGDNTNNCFQHLPNVTHIPVDQFAKHARFIPEFRTHFVNYSTNNAQAEYICYERVFLLRELMIQKGVSRIFYVDSDCIILEDIDRFFHDYSDIDCALSITASSNPHHMVSCIHNSVLTIDFCDKFIQLCRDIYINKSKFHLIHPKIDWHNKTNSPGGICDMTLYHILTNENEYADLNSLFLYDGDNCTFDHNLCVSYGSDGENTYKMTNGVKTIYKDANTPGKYYAEMMNGMRVRLLSMHFSGGLKRVLSGVNTNEY